MAQALSTAQFTRVFQSVVIVGICYCLLVIDASAQSLISQLPQVGTWASYEYSRENKLADGSSYKVQGEFTIRFVGEANVKGEEYCWIEFEVTDESADQNPQSIYKFLIKQRVLDSDQPEHDQPLKEYLQTYWRYQNSSRGAGTRKIDAASPQAAVIKYYLPPKLNDLKQLESKTIDTGLGKLKCAGSSGHWTNTQPSGTKVKLDFEVFTSKNSPFGSVLVNKTETYVRNGTVMRTRVIKLKLKQTGTGAKSALPDSK